MLSHMRGPFSFQGRLMNIPLVLGIIVAFIGLVIVGGDLFKVRNAWPLWSGVVSLGVGFAFFAWACFEIGGIALFILGLFCTIFSVLCFASVAKWVYDNQPDRTRD